MTPKTYISGLGSSIPTTEVKNDFFLDHKFLHENGSSFDQENEIIISNWKKNLEHFPTERNS